MVLVVVILCCICLCTGIWLFFKICFNSNQNNSPKKDGKKVRSKKRSNADKLEKSVTVTRPRHSRFDRIGRRSSRRRISSKSAYSSRSRARHSSHIHTPRSHHHRRSHDSRPTSSRLGHSSHRHRSRHELCTRSGHARRSFRERKNLHTNSKKSRQSDEVRLHSSFGLGQQFSSLHGSQHSRIPYHNRDDYASQKFQSVPFYTTNANINVKLPNVRGTPQRSKPGNVQTTLPRTVVIPQNRPGISDLNADSSSSEELSSEMSPAPQIKPHKNVSIVHKTTPQYVQEPANQFEMSQQKEHRDSDPESSSESSSKKTPATTLTPTQQNTSPASGVQSTRTGQTMLPKWPM